MLVQALLKKPKKDHRNGNYTETKYYIDSSYDLCHVEDTILCCLEVMYVIYIEKKNKVRRNFQTISLNNAVCFHKKDNLNKM